MNVGEVILFAVWTFVVLVIMTCLIGGVYSVLLQRKGLRTGKVALERSADATTRTQRALELAEESQAKGDQRYEESRAMAEKQLEELKRQNALLERIVAALEERRRP